MNDGSADGTAVADYFITLLEGRLKAAVELRPATTEGHWLLLLRLFYEGNAAGVLSFNLSGYSREEACAVAANIPANAFLMREIDEYLWGESD